MVSRHLVQGRFIIGDIGQEEIETDRLAGGTA